MISTKIKTKKVGQMNNKFRLNYYLISPLTKVT